MNTEYQDRSLHFVVRHESYSQHAGYGAFLNKVLQRLNKQPPEDASQLLYDTASLMAEEKSAQQPSASYFFAMKDQSGLGSAAAASFGDLQHLCKDPGWVMTPIISYTASSDHKIHARPYRSYFKVLANNQLEMAIEQTRDKQFSYTLKDGQTLPLMRILAGNQNITENINKLATKHNVSSESRIAYLTLYSNTEIAFIHPYMSEQTFHVLTSAIQEQMDVLDLNAKIIGNLDLPVDKKEALAAIYWLVAQSTPVDRGGSAYANIILEHLGERLKQQGYDYEVPYVKGSKDLWAEAATTGLERFKQRFVHDVYFDRSLTDKQVQHQIDEINQHIPDRHMQPESISRGQSSRDLTSPSS